jgi:hypothetical protein
LPEDEAKKFKDIISAVQAYDKAVDRAEKTRLRNQEKRKAERSSISAALEEAEGKSAAAKLKVEKATGVDTDYGKSKAIVERAEAAKKAQRDIN